MIDVSAAKFLDKGFKTMQVLEHGFIDTPTSIYRETAEKGKSGEYHVIEAEGRKYRVWGRAHRPDVVKFETPMEGE